MLIKDSAQRLRAATPNAFGMNGFAAERLQSFVQTADIHGLRVRWRPAG